MTTPDDFDTTSVSDNGGPESDRLSSIQEYATDRLGRRPFLKLGVVSIGIVGLLSSMFGSDDENPEREIEPRLRELATRIDERDLSDPQHTRETAEILRTELNTVEDLVEGEDVSPEKMDTIDSILEYYWALQGVLRNADTLTDAILDTESNIRKPQETELSAPDLDFYDQIVSRFEEQTHGLDPTAERVEMLTPELEATLREISQLQAGYEYYVYLQRNLIEAQSTLIEGIDERERGNAAAAKAQFDRIIDEMNEINRDRDGFELTDYSLTPSQYEKLLSTYLAGVDKMKQSCEDVDDPESYALFEEGLEHLFDARRVLERAY